MNQVSNIFSFFFYSRYCRIVSVFFGISGNEALNALDTSMQGAPLPFPCLVKLAKQTVKGLVAVAYESWYVCASWLMVGASCGACAAVCCRRSTKKRPASGTSGNGSSSCKCSLTQELDECDLVSWASITPPCSAHDQHDVTSTQQPRAYSMCLSCAYRISATSLSMIHVRMCTLTVI